MEKTENSNMKGWLVGIISSICLGLGAWALASTSDNKVRIGKVETKQEGYETDVKDMKKDIREIKTFIMDGNVTITVNKNHKNKINLTER